MPKRPSKGTSAKNRLDRARSSQNENGCWIWSPLDFYGYGVAFVGKKQLKAHRYSYETLVGPIPEGLVIDHLCRNRACVNPDHLEPVTLRENIQRGEARPVAIVRSGKCVNGHPLRDEVVGGKGPSAGRRKGCAACARDRYRERMQDPEWREKRARYERERSRRAKGENGRSKQEPGGDDDAAV